MSAVRTAVCPAAGEIVPRPGASAPPPGTPPHALHWAPRARRIHTELIGDGGRQARARGGSAFTPTERADKPLLAGSDSPDGRGDLEAGVLRTGPTPPWVELCQGLAVNRSVRELLLPVPVVSGRSMRECVLVIVTAVLGTYLLQNSNRLRQL